jgi:hypothetical protein
LVLFALARILEGHHELRYREQKSPTSGWSAWRSFGDPATVFGWPDLGPITGLKLAADRNGRLTLCSRFEKVYRDVGNVVLYLRQPTPSSNEWLLSARLHYPP